MVKGRRRRYLLFSTQPHPPPLPPQTLKKAVFESVAELFGAYGLSQADLRFMAYDEGEGRGLLRCSHTFLDKLRAALLVIAEVEGRPIAIRTITVSGTLKSIRDREGPLPGAGEPQRREHPPK